MYFLSAAVDQQEKKKVILHTGVVASLRGNVLNQHPRLRSMETGMRDQREREKGVRWAIGAEAAS